MSVGITVALPGAGENGVNYPSAYTGQSVADAIYNTVHHHPGGIQAVADLLDKNPNTLTHKVNPNATTNHVLGYEEMLRIVEVTNNLAIAHAICARLGGVYVRATPLATEATPANVISHVAAAFGDFMRALADGVEDGRTSPNELRRTEHAAQDLQSAISHALGLLHSQVRK